MVSLFVILGNLFWLSRSPLGKILVLLLNLRGFLMIFSYFLKVSWLSFIFSVLIISGLLVLFVYMVSLSKKEKTLKIKKITFFFFLFFLKINLWIWLDFIQCKEYNFLGIYLVWNFGVIMFILIVYIFLVLLLNLEIISGIKVSFRSC